MPFFNFSALGMPGVGVRPGAGGAPFIEMPSGILPLASIDSGVADNPSGRLFGSSLISRATLAFVLVFVFDVPLAPHPAFVSIAAAIRANFIFDILIKLRDLKYCAGLKVASPGVSDGVQTGTGRY